MFRIPEECRFRVRDREELEAVLTVLEDNGYHWNGGLLPTKLIPSGTYALHIYKGRRIMRSTSKSNYEDSPVFPEIDVSLILNGGASLGVSQRLAALF